MCLYDLSIAAAAALNLCSILYEIIIYSMFVYMYIIETELNRSNNLWLKSVVIAVFFESTGGGGGCRQNPLLCYLFVKCSPNLVKL